MSEGAAKPEKKTPPRVNQRKRRGHKQQVEAEAAALVVELLVQPKRAVKSVRQLDP